MLFFPGSASLCSAVVLLLYTIKVTAGKWKGNCINLPQEKKCFINPFLNSFFEVSHLSELLRGDK